MGLLAKPSMKTTSSYHFILEFSQWFFSATERYQRMGAHEGSSMLLDFMEVSTDPNSWFVIENVV